MKKLFDVIVLLLAVNFLALAGGVAYLYQTHRVDREKAIAIKAILFPPTSAPSSTTQASADPSSTQPVLKLEELLATKVGRSTEEQVEFLQHSFDVQMAQLDRRERELKDLQRQVDLAREQAGRDRAALGAQQKQLEDREQQATKLASDKGFQDALDRYNALPGKQVKQIFMTLDDQTVVNFLQAMEARPAARVIKEFKTPEEVARIQKILERMRLSSASDAKSAAAQSAPDKASNAPTAAAPTSPTLKE